MRIDRLLAAICFIAAILTGCAASAGSMAGISQTQETGPTRAPFLPESDMPTFPPTIISGMHTPAAAVTVTAIPATTDTPTPSLRVELEAVGDIMLGRTVADQLKAQGPGIVFSGVQSVFDSADVLVGNLECALTNSKDRQPKSYTFAAPPEAAQALSLAGFDVLSLANNHAMDYGSQGLADTRNNLTLSGVASVGAGANAAGAHAPLILVRNGLRLAFLAYADVPVESLGFDARSWIATDTQPGIAWADLDQITAGVTAAKARADVVIVLLHSGYEIGPFIPPVSTNQRAEAQAAIDAGAALVIGSHPHILQSIERYHGGLIAYSLGNFVFDDYQGIASASIILRVVLNPAGVTSYDWVPVLIDNGLPAITSIENAHGIETQVAP